MSKKRKCDHSHVVTDAFTVSALLARDERAQPLEGVLNCVLISALAVPELLATSTLDPQSAQEALDRVGIKIEPFDFGQAILACQIVRDQEGLPLDAVAGWCVAQTAGAAFFSCDPQAPKPPAGLGLKSLS